jgi:CRP-like cAMP-binding protein
MHASVFDSPKLRKFSRTYGAGEFLFKQGDSGTTLCIVLSGMVELLSAEGEKKHVIEIVEAGGFLGERSIVSKEAYLRHFSARTLQECKVIEVSAKDLEFLKISAPEIMTLLMTKAFEVAAQRLHRMNCLVAALKPSDNKERFWQCFLYYCRFTGTAVPNGLEVPLSNQSFCHYTDISEDEATGYLAGLEAEKLIEKLPNGFYLVPSLETLELR